MARILNAENASFEGEFSALLAAKREDSPDVDAAPRGRAIRSAAGIVRARAPRAVPFARSTANGVRRGRVLLVSPPALFGRRLRRGRIAAIGVVVPLPAWRIVGLAKRAGCDQMGAGARRVQLGLDRADDQRHHLHSHMAALRADADAPLGGGSVWRLPGEFTCTALHHRLTS